jgi:hypothetical protein
MADEPIVSVLSFDVGMRNHAGCYCDVQRDPLDIPRVKTMHHYYTEDILEMAGCTARVSRTVLTDRVVKFCTDSLRRNFTDEAPDVVVVEAQRGKKESILSGAILGFFSARHPTTKLRLMNALGKFKCAGGAPRTNGSKGQRHTQLKEAAVLHAEMLMPGLKTELGDKAEHVADAILQACSAGGEILPKTRGPERRRGITKKKK